MIIGYQYVSVNGLPVGNVQPTLEAAEEVARHDKAGRFYSIEKTERDQVFLRYLCSKGIA